MGQPKNFTELTVYRSAEESPGFLLWRTSTLWRRAIEGVLKPLDLTHPQFVILATIGWLTRNGGKASQVAIGKHASLDPNTISQIVRGLENKKLVQRLRTTDERTKYPTLTSAGKRTLAKALPAVESADTEFFSIIHLKKSNILEALQKLARFDLSQ